MHLSETTISPHLVLLDVRLPDGSGFDVCRRMREQGLRMPVIILTVQDDEIDKVVGLEVGADDYLTRPYPHSRNDGWRGWHSTNRDTPLSSRQSPRQDCSCRGPTLGYM